MGNEICYRPFSPGDEKSYLDLYNYIYPTSMSADYWQWYNIENPAGRSIIETAWDGDKLIGVYGLSPRWLSAGSRSIYGALSDVAITHPDYRYRGIFSTLGRHLYNRAQTEGIKVLYGFPTEHSKHSFKTKLNWDYIDECRALICWKFRKTDIHRGSQEIHRVYHVGIEFEELWKRIAAGPFKASILAKRNREYLEWRFLKQPTAKYLLYAASENGIFNGYIVIRETLEQGEKYFDIADIIAVDLISYRNLVEYIILCFEEVGFVRIKLPIGSVFYICAKDMGFKESGALYYFGCKLPRDLSEFGREWYYTTADNQAEIHNWNLHNS